MIRDFSQSHFQILLKRLMEIDTPLNWIQRKGFDKITEMQKIFFLSKKMQIDGSSCWMFRQKVDAEADNIGGLKSNGLREQ